MLIDSVLMAYIYRISEEIISVEGIECVRESDGRYYPTMPELANVSLFPDAADMFLDIEQETFERRWDITVEGLLEKLKINYGNN